MLTNAQLLTLKAHIQNSPDLSGLPMSPDGHYAIADLLNVLAEPAFIVWKVLVPNDEVGRAFNAASLSAMTSGNNDRLVSFALWNPGGVEPWRADHRQFFADVFSPASGAATRTALDALWRRSATRGEKLFATGGAGTTVAPATLTFEGFISPQMVEQARYL